PCAKFWCLTCFSLLGTLCPALSDVHFRVVKSGSTIPRGQALGRAANMTVMVKERGCAEQLARFFPGLHPLRIPVRVLPHRTGQSKLRETTAVEFGGKEFAIFLSALPLE